MNFDYLKPPSSVFEIKHAPEYIYQGKGTKALRKIFSNTEFTSFEKNELAKLYQLLDEKDIKIPRDWTQADLLRVIYFCNFEFSGKDGVISRLESLTRQESAFAANYLAPESLKILRKGWIYLGGVDKQYRPIIILNLGAFDNVGTTVDECFNALSFLYYQLQKNMFVPGYVENMIIILDACNMGPHQISINLLIKVFTDIGKNFPETIDKVLFLNVTTGIKFTWLGIQKVLSERNAKMINLLTSDELKTLQQFIDPEQLEKKYGGRKPDFKYEEDFWPPKSPFPPIIKSFGSPMSDKVRTPSKIGGSPSQRGFSPFNSKSPRSMGLRSMEATTNFGRPSEPLGDTQDQVMGKGFFNRLVMEEETNFGLKLTFGDPNNSAFEHPKKYDEAETYDLNDSELLTVVQQEVIEIVRNKIPEEEEIEERIKSYSSVPLNVSKKGSERGSPIRKGTYGGGKTPERRSIQDRMSPAGMTPRRNSVQNMNSKKGIPNWTIKKPKTEEEEDEEDDRGGLFCGICTSFRPVFLRSSNPPERKAMNAT